MRLTEQQLIERRKGLGGSDALAYCGLDPKKTPLMLYLEKTGEYVQEDVEENIRADWGHRQEPIIREWLAEKLGTIIFEEKIPFGYPHKSEFYPFMRANIDGYFCPKFSEVGVIEGVEIKNVDKSFSWQFGDCENTVPAKHIFQCMHYMIVTGWRRWHLAALIGGNDPRHYIIDYDESIANAMIEHAKSFWDRVEKRLPPEPTNIQDCALRWTAVIGKPIEANPEIKLALFDFKQKKTDIKALEEELKQAEFQVKSHMGDADTLIDSSGEVIATWKEQERKEYLVKASKFRVLRVK